MTPSPDDDDFAVVIDAIEKATMMLTGYGANNTVFLHDARKNLERIRARQGELKKSLACWEFIYDQPPAKIEGEK